MNKREREIIQDYTDSIKTDIVIYEKCRHPKVEFNVEVEFNAVDKLSGILEEGSNCPEAGCTGKLIDQQYSCSCSAMSNPPCSACENNWLECNECGDNPNE